MIQYISNKETNLMMAKDITETHFVTKIKILNDEPGFEGKFIQLLEKPIEI